MKITEALQVLKTYNKWLKGAEIPQEDPVRIGMAIDIVVGHHKEEPITKQALLDRGFKTEYGQMAYLKLSTCTIAVRIIFAEGNFVIFSRDIRENGLTVPNCRTLKQLDNLIDLFKEK